MKLCAWRVFFGVVPKMCMPKMCINVNTISKTYLIKRDRIFGQATCIGPILSVFTFVLGIPTNLFPLSIKQEFILSDPFS